MRKDFFEWTNPLWGWILSIMFLCVSTYGMYNVGYYSISRGDVTATILGILYYALIGWASCIYAFRCLYLSRIQNERK
jgi:hypothetical protein